MSSHHIAVHITCLHLYLKCFAYLSCFTCAVRISEEAVGAVVDVVAVVRVVGEVRVVAVVRVISVVVLYV